MGVRQLQESLPLAGIMLIQLGFNQVYRFIAFDAAASFDRFVKCVGPWAIHFPV